MTGCNLADPNAPGLVNGRLFACPETPNCVCSEYPGQSAIAPLEFSDDADDAWQSIIAAVTATGGDIKQQSSNYLHTTYTSRIFRFVDDLEIRLDREGGVIHIRSASRVGRSDLGVNRKRAERLRKAFLNSG
jgi:uncharacterized protein (DUF1499 family)